MIRTTTRIGILTALLLWPALASAGVVVNMEIRSPGEKGEILSHARMWVEGDRLRFDPQVTEEGATDQSILFVGGERRMLNIDHTQRWYGEMNPVLLEALKAQLATALKEVEKQLALLPDEQRAAVEKRVAEQLSPTGAALPERQVRPTEDRRQVGKYPAVRYEVLQDGVKIRDVWVTEWSNVQGGDTLRQGFAAVEDFIQSMVSSLQELPRMEALIRRMGDNQLKELTALPGLPVSYVQYEEGKPAQELVVTSVKQQDIPPEALAPPAGYTARNLFGGGP